MFRYFVLLLSAFMTIYFGIMYQQPILMGITVAELIIIVILKLSVNYYSKHIRIKFPSNIDVIQSNKNNTRAVLIENNGLFPISRFSFRIYINYKGEETRGIDVVAGALPGNSSVEFRITLPYAGKAEMFISKIVFYDYLLLFWKKQKLNLTQQLIVVPNNENKKIKGIEEIYNNQYSGYDEQSNQDKSLERSEFKQIREYQSGDLIRDIHWKLYSKTDKLLVKEFNSENEHIGYVQINFDSLDKLSISNLDSFYKLVNLLIINLLTLYDKVKVGFIDIDAEHEYMVSDETDLRNFIVELISANKPKQIECDQSNLYEVNTDLTIRYENKVIYKCGN